MKRRECLICAVFGVFILGWTYHTPLGITVKASEKVIAQYEHHWTLRWIDINWIKVDDFFQALQMFHGTIYDPRKLKIKVHPFRICGDDIGINKYCYEGWIVGNSISLHLGDDSAQEENEWCLTALSHEMNHWFLRGTRCYYGIDNKAECRPMDPGGEAFGLCH